MLTHIIQFVSNAFVCNGTNNNRNKSITFLNHALQCFVLQLNNFTLSLNVSVINSISYKPPNAQITDNSNNTKLKLTVFRFTNKKKYVHTGYSSKPIQVNSTRRRYVQND